MKLPPGPERVLSVRRQPGVAFALLIGGLLFVFVWGVGLGPDSLPFPRQSDYSDAATSHWPNALIFGRAIQAGTFPTENPYIMNGTPFAPNPLNKAWYPFQWFAALLPPTIHLNFLLWLHLTLGGVGAWLFARTRFEAGISAFVGLAYAFTPRLIAAAGAGHLDIVYAAAWLPWLLWAVHVSRLTFRRAVLIGGLAALCFLADVRLYVFIAAFTAVYWLVHARGQTGKRWLIVAAGVHLLLIAPLVIPLIGELPKLSRAGLTVEDAGVFSLHPANLIGLIIADQNGAHETLVSVGVSVLALALVGLSSRGQGVRFWGISVVIAGVYALGVNGGLWSLLVRIIPGLLWLRVPARAWLIAVFCLIMLAAYGLVALQKNTLIVRRTVGQVAIILLAVAFPCAVIFFAVDRYSTTTGIVLLLITVGLLILSARWPASDGAKRARRVILLWAVFFLIDVTVLNITLIEGVGRSDWLDRYQPLAEALRADQVDHFYSPSYSLPQQAAVYYQIPMIGGIDPFQYTAYVRTVEAATGVQATGYSVTLPALEGDPATVNRDAPLDPDKLAVLRVSHIVSAFPITNPALTLLRIVDNIYLYRNTRYAAPNNAR